MKLSQDEHDGLTRSSTGYKAAFCTAFQSLNLEHAYTKAGCGTECQCVICCEYVLFSDSDEHHPALLCRCFCHFGAIYKCHDLATYLLIYLLTDLHKKY